MFTDFRRLLMANLRLLLLISLVLNPKSAVFAQLMPGDIQGMFLTIGPATNLSDLSGASVMLLIKLKPDKSGQIGLGGYLEGTNSKIRATVQEGGLITLQQGPNMFNGYSLAPYFSLSSINVEGINENEILVKGSLPEDEYTLCIIAYNNAGIAIDTTCSSFLVNYPDPPIIISPTCDDTLKAISPQGINFQWNFPSVPIGVLPTVSFILMAQLIFHWRVVISMPFR